MINPITIVSCFYLLNNSKHSNINYVLWLINFFAIETPKVIFTDIKTYQKLFIKLKTVKNITFKICEIGDFRTSQILNNKDWKEQHNKDPEKSIHNIDLYKIWNEKTEFINKSIKENIYNSEYFFWCDAGIFRNKSLIHKYKDWPKLSKIKKHKNNMIMLEINKFLKEEVENNELCNFEKVNRIGGGIFGGNIETLKLWIKDYYNAFQNHLDNDLFVGKDQSIMANIYLNNLKKKNYIDLIKPDEYFLKNKGNVWFYLQDYLL